MGRGPARAQLTLVQASPRQVPGKQVAILLRSGQGRPRAEGLTAAAQPTGRKRRTQLFRNSLVSSCRIAGG